MTDTPWGEASTLKDRRLRPGPGAPRSEVERNQRERLYGATVAVVAGKGYASSSISDLIAVAGVSRTTFYKYFSDKEECFLATLDELVAAAIGATEREVRFEGSLLERAEQGLEVFMGLLVAQPDAARICIVEAYAAGPRAVERVDRAVARFRELVAYVLPEEMLAAMIGGVRKMLHGRLRSGTEAGLMSLVPQLLQLALAYRPPPSRLRFNWVRAKGTPGPTAEGSDIVERIELATMAVVARRGFADGTVAEISAEAGTSLSTFYAAFDGKREALEAGLYRRRLQMYAAVVPSYRTARSWAEGIREMILASLAFLESESDFAHLVTVDVYAAGGSILEHQDLAMGFSARFIEDAPGYDDLDISIAAGAIQSAGYSLLADRVRGGARELRSLAPLVTYLVVMPFCGPEDAARVASGQAPSG